jgi:hypothetical protein
MSDRIVAKLEITMTEDGLVSIAGTGALLKHKAYAFGMLELAKECMKSGPATIQPATLGDLPRM